MSSLCETLEEIALLFSHHQLVTTYMQLLGELRPIAFSWQLDINLSVAGSAAYVPQIPMVLGPGGIIPMVLGPGGLT